MLSTVCELLKSAAETELASARSPEPAFSGAKLLVCLDSAVLPLAFLLALYSGTEFEVLAKCVCSLWHEQGCIFDPGMVGLCKPAICSSNTAPMLGFKLHSISTAFQCSHGSS